MYNPLGFTAVTALWWIKQDFRMDWNLLLYAKLYAKMVHSVYFCIFCILKYKEYADSLQNMA